jgi:hypothetical protein
MLLEVLFLIDPISFGVVRNTIFARFRVCIADMAAARSNNLISVNSFLSPSKISSVTFQIDTRNKSMFAEPDKTIKQELCEPN